MEYLMQDLIELLSLIFPDVSKGLNAIGNLALIFGLANAFFGYKIFKMILWRVSDVVDKFEI